LSDQLSILIAGATGFIGGRLVSELAKSDHAIRCLVRDPSRASDLRGAGHEVCQGDLLDADSLQGVARGVDFAYYLVHSMGRGADGPPLTYLRAAMVVGSQSESFRTLRYLSLGCR
jgi:uncharacterized protein YbjT (DUF2867 family)